jgi:hypothetical protein
MPTDMIARQLIKQIPFVSVSNIETVSQTSDVTGDGWKQIEYAGGGLIWVWRGFIDLAGYTQDELTFFSQVVDIQKAQIPTISSGVFWLNVVDLVTTRRIRTDELYPNNFKNSFLGGPSDGNNLDIQEVVYGEWVSVTPYSATNPAAIVLGGDTFGTGNPTASDRLHCTRIVTMNGPVSGESFGLGGCNYLIGGVTAHEKDLVYIERLRRAYTQERS